MSAELDEKKNEKKKRNKIDIAPRALSVPQSAAYLSVTPNTLYKVIRSGAVPLRKIGTRSVILRDDLDRFLEALPTAEVGAA